MAPTPILSVLMPVYNCRPFVDEALHSILDQSFSDFELIVIDDASTDGTGDAVRAVKDQRIRIIRNDSNLRVGGSLNRAMEIAQGKYIARMDGDDICLPGRFARQLAYMEAHPTVCISGGGCSYFGAGMPFTVRPQVAMKDIAAGMFFDNPMCHVTVIMRRELLDRHSLRYDTAFSCSEDYELWTRAIQCVELTNLPDVLVKVRLHRSSVMSAHSSVASSQVLELHGRLLGRLGLNPSPEDLAFHHQVGHGRRINALADIRRAEAWLSALLDQNSRMRVLDAAAFRRAVGRVWSRVCMNSTPIGASLWSAWQRSPLRVQREGAMDQCRFLASLAWHGVRRRLA